MLCEVGMAGVLGGGTELAVALRGSAASCGEELELLPSFEIFLIRDECSSGVDAAAVTSDMLADAAGADEPKLLVDTDGGGDVCRTELDSGLGVIGSEADSGESSVIELLP